MMVGMDVVVIGAGVGGLGSALALSRRGHRVTIVERDATPMPSDPHGAFAWNRRGAPQVRHSHALLARLRNLLRDQYPDVLDALFDAGATELRFMDSLPEGMVAEPEPGDEDLVALACRRTTFEWVLRRTVLADDGVELHDGHAVVGLTFEPSDIPRVTGVRLDDGTEIAADLVVAAGGRRENVLDLLGQLGIDLDERIEDTGIIYLSRFFELVDGADFPPQSGPIGGDLGYLKYGVFPGDNRTFSITLATRTDDAELRSKLLDPDTFLSAAAALPATAPYVDGRANPITDVEVMARLLNRDRRFLDTEDGLLVEGFAAVGDAHTCTNPLYGRGCSLAMVMSQMLADAVEEFGDARAAVLAYELRNRDEIHPWYRAAVSQDAATRAAIAAERGETATDDSSGDGADTVEEDPMRALLREGLLPALREDPVVLRAFLRMLNLLDPPESLMSNFDVLGRVMQSYQNREERPAEPSLGPDRAGLLADLAA
ncbi:MAG TPA: FAD-dependent oxidoreductase [Microthrixaceae bacterium]|nr:FAD-dependent oxidoreductase [Microthrixaceae bacterium]